MTRASTPVEELAPAEVAKAINSRLHRMEADKAWNLRKYVDSTGREQQLSHLFSANASLVAGGKVRIVYISYQGSQVIDVEQARDYLQWLRDGNRGTHHSAPLRPSKAQEAARQSAEARSVEYERSRSVSRWGDEADVLNAVYVPEGAQTKAAQDVVEGDRVFFKGQWRTVQGNREYVAPMPEQAHEVAAQIQDAVRMGDYARAADLAGGARQTFNELADGRDFERTLVFKGSIASVALTPECEVAVRAKPQPRQARTGGRLKVYAGRHWLHGGERDLLEQPGNSVGRRVVAAPTKRLALELFGIESRREADDVSETGNEREREVALANPGKVVLFSDRGDRHAVVNDDKAEG